MPVRHNGAESRNEASETSPSHLMDVGNDIYFIFGIYALCNLIYSPMQGGPRQLFNVLSARQSDTPLDLRTSFLIVARVTLLQFMTPTRSIRLADPGATSFLAGVNDRSSRNSYFRPQSGAGRPGQQTNHKSPRQRLLSPTSIEYSLKFTLEAQLK